MAILRSISCDSDPNDLRKFLALFYLFRFCWLCHKKTTTIQSRQSSPPLPHRLQCSGSQDSFATDSFCGNGGVHLTNHTGNQWQITNCADTICPHMAGPNVSAIPSTIHNSASGSIMPLVPPSMCNPYGSNSFNSFPTRWGPRTSCPIHSPFRGRIPNGSICSGHQVNGSFTIIFNSFNLKRKKEEKKNDRSF